MYFIHIALIIIAVLGCVVYCIGAFEYIIASIYKHKPEFSEKILLIIAGITLIAFIFILKR